MPAFLSSTQIKELHQEKAIIELDVAGFGLVVVTPNPLVKGASFLVCERCGKMGHVTLPAGVVGCMHCQHMDVSRSSVSYEETEAFREVLDSVPAMLREAKEYYHRRYGRTP